MLKGIDISHWQGKPDFDKVKTQVDFIIIKATEGTNFIDSEFTRNQSEIRRVGLGLGYYHYARPEFNSAEAEADWFTSHLNIKDGEIVALDYESTWSGDVVKWSLAFLERVKSNLNGLKPLVYINKSLKKALDWSPVVNGDYGLWLADYEGTGTSVPWSFIAFTQTSSKGRIDGISSNSVDLDTFYNDINVFKKYGYVGPEIVNDITPWYNIENFDKNTNSEFYKNKFYNNDWSIINDINDRDIEIENYKTIISKMMDDSITDKITIKNLTDQSEIFKTGISDFNKTITDLKTENNRLASSVTDLQGKLAVVYQNNKDFSDRIIVLQKELESTYSPIEDPKPIPNKTITNKFFNSIVNKINKFFSTKNKK